MTATEIACLCIGAAGILTALLPAVLLPRACALQKMLCPDHRHCPALPHRRRKPQSHLAGGRISGGRETLHCLPALQGRCHLPQIRRLRCGEPPFRVRAGCSPHPHRRHVLQLRGTRRSALAHWQYHARGLQSPQSQAGLRGKAGQPWRYGRRDIALHRRGTGGFRRRNVFALSITERNLHDDLTIRTKYFQNIHGAQSPRQCVVLPQ